tara:strand:+ start:481 stop:1188 length:708 start_codon:yes stop_codon:yes gene_type:complete
MKPIHLLLFISFFFSTELFSQQGFGGMVDRAKQAMMDLGNRSSRKPKPITIQGTHYFNEDFEVATLDYFGTELNDKGFMRYNAFRDEIEMASTTTQNESDLILMQSKDIVPVISGEKYIYIPHRLEDGRAHIGYLILLYEGKKNTVYIKRKKVFMEEVVARTGLENPFPPRFVDDVKIYVSKNGDTPTPLRTKKKIVASFFKENSDQVRKFIKANRLKVSEPKAIIKIFEFADNL